MVPQSYAAYHLVIVRIIKPNWPLYIPTCQFTGTFLSWFISQHLIYMIQS